MGKAHSNAYVQAPHFFDLPYRIVRTLICGRDPASLSAMADRWGWEETCDRLASGDRSQGCRRRRHLLCPTICTPRSRSLRRRLARSILCEKPLALIARRGASDGRRRPQRGDPRLVQLSPRASDRVRAPADRRRPARARLSLQCVVQAAVGRRPDAAATLEDGSSAGWIRRRRRSAHAPARHRPLPQRADDSRGGDDAYVRAESPGGRRGRRDGGVRQRERRHVRGHPVRHRLQELATRSRCTRRRACCASTSSG